MEGGGRVVKERRKRRSDVGKTSLRVDFSLHAPYSGWTSCTLVEVNKTSEQDDANQ